MLILEVLCTQSEVDGVSFVFVRKDEGDHEDEQLDRVEHVAFDPVDLIVPEFDLPAPLAQLQLSFGQTHLLLLERHLRTAAPSAALEIEFHLLALVVETDRDFAESRISRILQVHLSHHLRHLLHFAQRLLFNLPYRQFCVENVQFNVSLCQ